VELLCWTSYTIIGQQYYITTDVEQVLDKNLTCIAYIVIHYDSIFLVGHVSCIFIFKFTLELFILCLG